MGKKDNQKSLIILIIILLLLVVSLTSYIIYDKLVIKDNENEEIISNDVESNDQNNNMDVSNITKEELYRIINNELYLLIGKKNLNELTNQEKLRMLFLIYHSEKGYPTEKFKKEELEIIHKNSVLSNLDIEYTDINDFYRGGLLETPDIKFKLVDDFYVNNGFGHGDIKISLHPNIVDFIKEDNKYIISYKYLFSAGRGDGPTNIDLYDNIENAISLENEIKEFKREEVNYDDQKLLENVKSYVEDNYNNLESNLDTYTYIFEIKDNNIILTDFYRK